MGVLGWCRWVVVGWGLIGVVGCAVSPSTVTVPGRSPAFLLLGEVHDNPDGHARRLQDLKARIEQGWRPALAMEQFDLDRTNDLSEAQRTCPDAACVIQRAGGASWDWALYRPLIDLALQYRLPLVAANLSRGDARQVVREGWDAVFSTDVRTAFGWPGAWTPAVARAQEAEVQRGHCNLTPARLLPGLALAQAARDVGMAQAMWPYRARGVVLVAGNGHVRSDVGVPYWLRQRGAVAADVRSVAYLEQGDHAALTAFDAVVFVSPQNRTDPCEGFVLSAVNPVR